MKEVDLQKALSPGDGSYDAGYTARERLVRSRGGAKIAATRLQRAHFQKTAHRIAYRP